MLEMKLQKPGDSVPKLSLSLKKESIFNIELSWDSTADVDAHALLARNNGDGAKVNTFDQILSTYNCKSTNPAGTLVSNSDGSFSTPCGSLTHGGDSRDGTTQDVDETILIDGSKIKNGENEILVFVTIHAPHGKKFSEVKEAKITIKDDAGTVLCEYMLSSEFASFDAVQMGSIILTEDSTFQFHPVGVGFNGDFNRILSTFS
ncbi:MAG: stress protein [Flammeovirgaceae bacterium]|nr:stress protein [Flammeovirgaceae bacterium]MBE63594.1 stress protein [Flammeovirgaceae bacterium]MBR06331.1 stress protein [Rickettsiales bacterium]|tara:strand:- start:329 stop:940 length:612 start_codon:yes stop_codon:yes gene_type:complete